MYKNKYDYKYDSYDAKDETDKFTVTPSMSYVPPSKEKSELPFDIKDAGKDKNLKSVAGAESAGTVFFSGKTGRISKSSMKMKVEGTVVISIGGTDTDVGSTKPSPRNWPRSTLRRKPRSKLRTPRWRRLRHTRGAPAPSRKRQNHTASGSFEPDAVFVG